MARFQWLVVTLLSALLLAGCGSNVVSVANRPTTPTAVAYRPAPTPTLTPRVAGSQDGARTLPASPACQTYATAIAGPSFGASWIPDLERACLGISLPSTSAGSSAILVPTAVAWPADPRQPIPASSGLWASDPVGFLEKCGVSCSPSVAGTCGVSDYAVVAGSTGLAYYPPSAAFGVNAAYCVDGYGGPPRGIPNGADPFGFCARSGNGCVGPSGGPCDAYEAGCVPYEAADTASRCDWSGACADDPYSPEDESMPDDWFDPVARCERGYGSPDDCPASDDGSWFPSDTESSDPFGDPLNPSYDNPYAQPDEPYDLGADRDACEPGFGGYDDC
ncbi:MAG: hypothetical protein M3Q71_02435 [Chloroflexota bacterium]|nr:hypothetical protein [Chloroflexota bacterium]